jgi:hypothetical protein
MRSRKPSQRTRSAGRQGTSSLPVHIQRSVYNDRLEHEIGAKRDFRIVNPHNPGDTMSRLELWTRPSGLIFAMAMCFVATWSVLMWREGRLQPFFNKMFEGRGAVIDTRTNNWTLGRRSGGGAVDTSPHDDTLATDAPQMPKGFDAKVDSAADAAAIAAAKALSEAPPVE